MKQKNRFEIVIKADDSEQGKAARDKIIQLFEGLVAISNGEAIRSGMSLRVSLKAK